MTVYSGTVGFVDVLRCPHWIDSFDMAVSFDCQWSESDVQTILHTTRFCHLTVASGTPLGTFSLQNRCNDGTNQCRSSIFNHWCQQRDYLSPIGAFNETMIRTSRPLGKARSLTQFPRGQYLSNLEPQHMRIPITHKLQSSVVNRIPGFRENWIVSFTRTARRR